MNANRVIAWTCLVLPILCIPAWSQTTKSVTAPATQNAPANAAPDFTVVGNSSLDKQGFTSWMISSPYQEGINPVEILVPDQAKKDTKARFPVIYFLQVGPDFGAWGNPIVEARKLDLHNKHGVIFVLPAFKAVKRQEALKRGGGPWYADHPTDPGIRHESYLVKAIVPFIEQHYPVLEGPRGRLLLGFSMSGCGAFNLLIRHPDVFGKAAAWDAPSSWTWWQLETRAKSRPYSYGPQLIAEHADMLKAPQPGSGPAGKSRLAVLGYDVYRKDAESVHNQLLSLGIPHDYDNDTWHKHGWNSGWLASAVEILLK